MSVLKITKEYPSKKKVFDLIHIGLYTLCFVGVTFHLNEVDNMIRQTYKDRQSLIAMVFFMAAVWVMQKVRLINWQSLVTTLLVVPFAVFGVITYSSSPDVYPNTILSYVVFWMAFMVVVDMVVTKRVRKIKGLSEGAFIFFCAMTALLMIYSHGYPVPYTYGYFIIVCLIPMEKRDWEKVLIGVLNAGVVSFIAITLMSFLVNPYFGIDPVDFMRLNPEQHGRWYGYFLNIGCFGQYLGLNLVLSLGSMYYAKQKKGRLSVAYFLSVIWLLADLFLAVLNGTTNYAVGLILLLLVYFIFGWKKATGKGMVIRGVIVAVILAGLIIASLKGIQYVYSDEFDADAIIATIKNSPFAPVSSGAEYIVKKLAQTNELRDIKESAFPPRSVGRFLDYFSSSRLGISYEFLKKSTFQGTDGGGIQYYLGDYFAYNAHNQYVQVLYNYGFLAGGVHIIFAITLWIISIVMYRRTKKAEHFLPMTGITVMLGMWMGEMSDVYYSLTFFVFLLALILFIKEPKPLPDAFLLLKQRDLKKADAGEAKEKKVVFCLGSKSIGYYGGYETFVRNLIERGKNTEIQYVIACKANGTGKMELKDLAGARRINESEFLYRDAIGYLVPVHEQYGSAQAIEYDIESLKQAIEYIKKNNIENPVVFIMACRIGPFFKKYVKQIHKLGGQVYINPDGHEWKRGKWPAPIRKYWKESEKKMVKYADLVICDSRNIEEYIKTEYEKYTPETAFVAYGAETDSASSLETEVSYKKWLAENNLKEGEYYLSVGRFVPENNPETILREFLNSGTKKSLVVITTVNDKLFDKINKKLHFTEDSRIHFVGTVYRPDLLKRIREGACGYFHGHSVGGTNPSLLEALGSTKLNFLYDVSFNREVAEDAGIYWTLEEGSLAEKIKLADAMSEEEVNRYGEMAKERIRKEYSWEKITEEYKACFLRTEGIEE